MRIAPGTSIVMRRAVGRLAAEHEQQRADDGERRHDHVDAERPAPRVVGGEEAADDGPERRRRRPTVAPHAANAVARSRPWNVVDRIASVAGSISEAPMPSMIASPTMRLGDGPRQRRQQRADAEQRGADDEDAAVAVDVAEPAADDEQGGEGERVAGDDPLEAWAAWCGSRAGSSGWRRSARCCRAPR